MILICPAIIATVDVLREKADCTETLQKLQQESGGFGFIGDRAVLGNAAAEQHYVFRLAGMPCRLDYVTTQEAAECLTPDRWEANSGVILTGDQCILWSKKINGSFSAIPIPSSFLRAWFLREIGPQVPESSFMLETPEYRSDALVDAVKKALPEKPLAAGQNADFAPVDMALIRNCLLLFWWTTVFALYFTECLVLLLIGGLFFTLVEFLHSRILPVKLPFSRILVLTLYAMFPAYLIASLSVVLGQTFLSFQNVFFIVFFIYQLLSFRHLNRLMNPPPRKPEPPLDDDDDF